MSNDYTPTRLIPIEEFKKASWIISGHITIIDDETIESEFFDDNFLLRYGKGKESKYLTVYVKEGFVVGFTMSGDPTNNDLLEIIQRTFEVKMINFDYHWQHSL